MKSVIKSGWLLFLYFLFISGMGYGLNWSSEPGNYTPGEELTLVITLPVEIADNYTDYILSIEMRSGSWKYNEVFAGDQIQVKTQKKVETASPDADSFIFRKKTLIDKSCSGDLNLLIKLYNRDTLQSVITSIIPENRKMEQGDKPIPLNLENHEKNPLPNSKKDYRERYFYGDVSIGSTSWPLFPLYINAERIIGGGAETTFIKIFKSGRFQYRLGNLYPYKYRLRLVNIKTEEGLSEYEFSGDQTSKNYNFKIDSIDPVDLGVYEVSTTRIEKKDEYLYHYLKAYICRFDKSVVKQVSFHWQFEDKIYLAQEAPENNRCLPIYPSPVVIHAGEKKTVEFVINLKTPKDINLERYYEKMITIAYDTNLSNDSLEFEITGGSEAVLIK